MELYHSGMPINKIARELEVNWGCVAKFIRDLGFSTNRIARGLVVLQLDNAGYMGKRVGDKWVREHRAKAETALGRKLERHEVVHHINGNKTDNRNENLLICTQPYHVWLHWRMSDLFMQEHFA